MEVRDERVDDRKTETGRYEDLRRVRAGGQRAVVAHVAFEGAYDGRSGGDDATPLPFCAGDSPDGFRRDFVRLAVHRMLVDAIALHRPERSDPDVERQAHELDAASFEMREQLGREMQRRRRRSHAAGHAREHRLISALRGVGIALYVRRQRKPAGSCKEFRERRVDLQCDRSDAALARVDHRRESERTVRIGETHALAGRQPARRPGKGDPAQGVFAIALRTGGMQEQELDPAARRLASS